MTLRLVIDGANVVGARPDGWWRDRAAAARRLHRALAVVHGQPATVLELADPDPLDVILVLEGAARGGVPQTLSDGEGVAVVHASGSGDDAVVALSSVRPCCVVTADRGLRVRLPATAQLRGPGWLWAHLDRLGGRGLAGPAPSR